MNKSSVQLIGLSGLLGVIILIASFIINPGPGINPTLHDLIQFSKEHYISTMIGSWMQAISPPLIVTFALGIVFIARQNDKLIGMLTFLGGLTLLMVSMIEVTFYFSALTGTPGTTGLISMQLISSVQRLYGIIAAPFFFFSLSALVIKTNVLPSLMGYIGFFLGSCFFILGIIQLFTQIQDIVNVVSMIQGFWWLIAAIFVLKDASRLANNQ
ncbi:MAG: hypothetical protein M3R50_08365 [Bacteroidota bacterium]|nr:hypothetical protein [Bacteroidota bacterium]